ncbi:MAG: ATP-binding protein, partial [Thermoguttaceae bacterium]
CLTNASRHSQSPKIRVELSQLENRVRLTVQDWGVGFDPHEVKGERFGLRGIRERVRLLGGAAEINSAPDKGTTIIVELPLVEGDIDEDDNNSDG